MGFLNVTSEGYIKLWRKIRRWPIWRALNWDQRGVVISILWAANWRDQHIDVPGHGLALVSRGSFLCTQQELAKYAGVSRQTVRSTLVHLQQNKAKNLLTGEVTEYEPFITTHHLARACTLIAVVNYAFYQAAPGDPTGHPTTAPTTGPTTGPTTAPTTLYMKKVKKVKKGNSTRNDNLASHQDQKDLLTIAPEAWALADLHRELLLKHDPDNSCGGPRWSKQRWAKAYDQGQRTTCKAPLPWDYIERVLRWALDESDDWDNGKHWRDFVTTPGKLFAKWDTLRQQVAKDSETRLKVRPEDWSDEKQRRDLEELGLQDIMWTGDE
jgi:hypothetical protein